MHSCWNKSHVGKTHQCRKCGKPFKAYSSLSRHQRTASREHCTNVKNVECVFISSIKLKTSLKPRVEIYKCSECKKISTRKTILVHISEEQEKNLSNILTVRNSLHGFLTLKHIREFKQDKKTYQCSDCGQFFVHSSYLRIHQRIHMGEKPYKDHDCGKFITQSSYLRICEWVHTEEKPYSVVIVGNSFHMGHIIEYIRELI